MSDYVLYTLRSKEDSEQELLFAVIMQRICPELLEVPYDRNKCFKDGIKEEAKRICRKYPSNIQVDKSLRYEPEEYKIKINDCSENREDMLEYLQVKFMDPMAQKLFTNHFGEKGLEMIDKALKDFNDMNIANRMERMVAVTAIMEMLTYTR